jgi:tRNA pseudouridine38-40 synthase
LATYKSIVAYDGTGFAGFQRLGQEQRTVQSVLEAGLRRLGWDEPRLLAAGRTDRGAHARGQVIAFRLAWRHTPEALTAALNAALPEDVAVRVTELAPDGFHPRFWAVGRRYSYAVFFGRLPDPLREARAWRLWPPPDEGLLGEAARRVCGTRDFGAFGRPPIPHGHTRRTMRRCTWEICGDQGVFEAEADAFLHHMVRRLVAATILIGQGRASLEHLQASLDHPDRPWPGRLAPAHGLCLEAVEYPAAM